MKCKHAVIDKTDGEVLGCKCRDKEWQSELKSLLEQLEDEDNYDFFTSSELCRVCAYRDDGIKRDAFEAREYLKNVIDNDSILIHL